MSDCRVPMKQSKLKHPECLDGERKVYCHRYRRTQPCKSCWPCKDCEPCAYCDECPYQEVNA